MKDYSFTILAKVEIGESKPRCSGLRFTNIKTLLSLSLTGSFPMKNYASIENSDSGAW